MTKKEDTSLAVLPSSETLAALKNEFPQEDRKQHISLPRLSLVSQDITEEVKVGGKKQINIVTEAGTFVEEYKTDEIDPDTGKGAWAKHDLGTEIEGIIIYQRKQLRYYDQSTEKFTSSPIYDSVDEIIPLFCDGKEIARGTPRELQAQYPQKLTTSGKQRPALEENKVLYLLYGGKPYQMTVRGTSMYSFLEYARGVNPPTVVTAMSSEAKENGTTKWNQMTFKAVRSLNADEADEVLATIRDIKTTIHAEKAQYTEVLPVPTGRTVAVGEF